MKILFNQDFLQFKNGFIDGTKSFIEQLETNEDNLFVLPITIDNCNVFYYNGYAEAFEIMFEDYSYNSEIDLDYINSSEYNEIMYDCFVDYIGIYNTVNDTLLPAATFIIDPQKKKKK